MTRAHRLGVCKKSRYRLFLASLFVLAAAAGPAQAGKREAPLPVEDVLSMLYFRGAMPISLSADGESVAYVLEDRTKKQKWEPLQFFTPSGASVEMVGSDVWVTNTRTGRSQNLTNGQGTSWGPQWSPDGRLLAFYSDRSGIAHLWLWEGATGALRQASELVTRSFYQDPIQWSPDGRRILVHALPESVSESALSGVAPRPEPASRNPSDKPTVRLYSFPEQPESAASGNAGAGPSGSSFLERLKTDVALVDVVLGRAQRIAKGHAWHWARFSPDGTRVAFTARAKRRSMKTYQVWFDLVVVSLADGTGRTLAREIPNSNWGGDVSWSPDGSRLAYSTSGQEADRKVYVISINGGEPRAITIPLGSRDPLSGEVQRPLWDQAGKTLYVVSDGSLWRASVGDGSAERLGGMPDKSITTLVTKSGQDRVWTSGVRESFIVVARDDKTADTGLYKVEIPSGQWSALEEKSRSFGVQPELTTVASGDGRLIVFLSESSEHPEDLWITDGDFRRARQLTHVNPKIDGIRAGERRIVHWKGKDAAEHRGFVLLPGGYEEGKHYPTVVFVYADDTRYSGNSFGFWGGFFNMQFLATRGYVVFYPEAPIRKGEPLRGLGDIVLPGIDRLVELGFTDPARIGVMGHSYGGYATLSLLVQSTRFKAAVESAGPADLLSMYGAPLDGTGISFGTSFAEGQEGMAGTPWEARDQYVRNSPWSFLDRIQTPLLILQGTADLDLTPQSDSVFIGLKRLGKTVVYAKYEGEEHAEEWWSWRNKVDAAHRYIDWFDRHLK